MKSMNEITLHNVKEVIVENPKRITAQFCRMIYPFSSLFWIYHLPTPLTLLHFSNCRRLSLAKTQSKSMCMLPAQHLTADRQSQQVASKHSGAFSNV